MKVIHLVPKLTGGGGGICNYAGRLAATQAGSGRWIPCVVAAGEPGAAIDVDTWRSVGTSVAKMVGPAIPGFAPSMQSLVRSLQPDVIHSHGLWLYYSFVAQKWGRRTKRGRVVSIHGLLNPHSRRNRSEWKKTLAMWLIERSNLTEATCVHVLTSEEAKVVRDAGFRSPLAIIPNAVEDVISEDRLYARPGRRQLLYLGQLNEGKGVYELCEAWAELVKADSGICSQWQLKIAGWGDSEYISKISEIISSSMPVDAVTLVGPASGPAKLACYREASAFVLPSFSEGMPTVVLEAWQHRLPVAMLDKGYFGDAFKAGAAYRLSPQSLCDDLRRFLALVQIDPGLLVNSGTRLIREQYNWTSVAAHFSAVYEWITGNADIPKCVIID